ncbi:MAG: hypothetical protein IJM04_04295 [Prevotella sp.]|nr:hypothetical protein [Prevotella sp.]
MKKISLLLFSISTLLASCSVSPETEAENNAHTQLREQAKVMLNFPDTYDFKKIDSEKINDTIIHVTLTFSGKNAFGVEETNSVDGYFNVKKGGERDFSFQHEQETQKADIERKAREMVKQRLEGNQ